MRKHLLLLLPGLALACIGVADEAGKTTLVLEELGAAADRVDMVERELRRAPGVTTFEVYAERDEARVAYDPEKADAGEIAESLSKAGTDVRLPQWEPVDASFNGCSNGWCGSRRPNARVSVQPGAAIGQDVYCPVSGVVLRIRDATPTTDLNGKPVYVCCAGCLKYFKEHRDRVLALRGMKAAG